MSVSTMARRSVVGAVLFLTLSATAERIEMNFDFDWLFYLSEHPGYNR